MNRFKVDQNQDVAAVLPIFMAMLVVGLLASFAGCGRGQMPLAPAGGKVLYRGKPLEFGSVIFVPKGGGPLARGTIGPDGTFTLSTDGKEGAVVARHAVRITCATGQSPAAGGEEAVLGRSLIPEKYTRSQTSGLEVEVKAGDNEPFIFDLQ